jgi:hypothetical protein
MKIDTFGRGSMLARFSAAQLAFQIKFPSTLRTHVLGLITPFRVGKKSQFQYCFNLNVNDKELIGSVETKHPKRHLNIISGDDELSIGKINTQNIEIVSAAMGLLLVVALSKNQGLLLHGSCFKHNGLAYLFLGRSGAGKSTIARRALGVTVVHDDRIAVRKIKDRWWAFGLPLCDNDKNTGRNIEAPLAGVYLIHKSNRLAVSHLGVKNSLQSMAQNVVLPVKDKHIVRDILQTLITFVSENRCYKLRFKRDSNVVNLVERCTIKYLDKVVES